MKVVTEVKNRGVCDIFIAIEAVYPRRRCSSAWHTWSATRSLRLAQGFKAVATDLKAVYHAATLEEAARQLVEFKEAWAGSYPVVARSWRLTGRGSS